MPNYASLRAAFAAFIGPEKYLQFLQTGIPPKRLKFWQEVLWNQFLAQHPEYDLPRAELVVAFCICYLHGDELHSLIVKARKGNVDYAPQHYEIRRTKFPFAGMDIITNEGNPEIDLVTVYYCKKCRAAYHEHYLKFFRHISDETYRFQRSMLTRRVELEDYLTFHGQVDPAGFDERTQGRLQQRRDDVAELMQPGDELWEWRESLPYSRIGGLVLLRGETVIQAWGDYKP